MTNSIIWGNSALNGGQTDNQIWADTASNAGPTGASLRRASALTLWVETRTDRIGEFCRKKLDGIA